MVKSPLNDPVLIQPVDSPVICKPYYEPTRNPQLLPWLLAGMKSAFIPSPRIADPSGVR